MGTMNRDACLPLDCSGRAAFSRVEVSPRPMMLQRLYHLPSFRVAFVAPNTGVSRVKKPRIEIKTPQRTDHPMRLNHSDQHSMAIRSCRTTVRYLISKVHSVQMPHCCRGSFQFHVTATTTDQQIEYLRGVRIRPSAIVGSSGIRGCPDSYVCCEELQKSSHMFIPQPMRPYASSRRCCGLSAPKDLHVTQGRQPTVSSI